MASYLQVKEPLSEGPGLGGGVNGSIGAWDRK